MKKEDTFVELVTKLINANDEGEAEEIRGKLMKHFENLPPDIKKAVMKDIDASVKKTQ
jgi:hypothetical protein